MYHNNVNDWTDMKGLEKLAGLSKKLVILGALPVSIGTAYGLSQLSNAIMRKKATPKQLRAMDNYDKTYDKLLILSKNGKEGSAEYNRLNKLLDKYHKDFPKYDDRSTAQRIGSLAIGTSLGLGAGYGMIKLLSREIKH